MHRDLAKKGITVYLVGGMFKGATDAVIGSQAVEDLKKYNFTKGFFWNEWCRIKSSWVYDRPIRRKQ